MPRTQIDPTNAYSPVVGLVYIFNLIVGTGALTMPAAFKAAGWMLSLIVVCILCVMSYLTATFMIEAMAAANALIRWKTLQHCKRIVSRTNDDDASSDGEHRSQSLVNEIRGDSMIARSINQDNERTDEKPIVNKPGTVRWSKSDAVESISESNTTDYFAITERFEMGNMAQMFYSKVGLNLFYACIAIYLYGDLAIYAAAVSKSLRDVTCNSPTNKTGSVDLCWKNGVSRSSAYYLYLVIFTLSLGPFTFFNVSKTKYLQIVTTILRWKAFLSMIILCFIALLGGKGKGRPDTANFMAIPNLFGVCVYSFMCHHSLPSLITPIREKRGLFALLAADYLLILVFYSLLSFTGIFTFDHIYDMYTLNFEAGEDAIVPKVVYLQYFLPLFPVLTLSSNFPIIAITLRNNLKALFLPDIPTEPTKTFKFLDRVFFPLLALLPPIAVAFITERVDFLVGITGSYAGAMIQYVVPATLVYFSRREVLQAIGLGVRNQYSSPFRHSAWIVFVLIWTVACAIFVTVHHVSSLVKSIN